MHVRVFVSRYYSIEKCMKLTIGINQILYMCFLTTASKPAFLNLDIFRWKRELLSRFLYHFSYCTFGKHMELSIKSIQILYLCFWLWQTSPPLIRKYFARRKDYNIYFWVIFSIFHSSTAHKLQVLRLDFHIRLSRLFVNIWCTIKWPKIMILLNIKFKLTQQINK